MGTDQTLLLTDVVDSTRVNDRLGDADMAALWEAHDHAARALMQVWGAQEVARSDGFLLLFDNPVHALGFAHVYHQALGKLETPLQARIGIHTGPVKLRRNLAPDVQRGAPLFEVDGVALPLAARLMAASNAGQTLTSAQALQALGKRLASNQVAVCPPTAKLTSADTAVRLRFCSHGFWRFKGIETPLEVFEAGPDSCSFTPPRDSAKAYRVTLRGADWLPARDIPHTLPAERDAFVGRKGPLSALAALLDRGARLSTVQGPGGVGKTRLSIHFARRRLGDYEGGIWFCDLSTSRSLDGIAHAVAQGLELDLDKANPIQLIGTAIAGRGNCLVILDNFEQVVSFAEETVGHWLQLAAESTFIVTSRERLGLVGESVVILDPLEQEEAEELLQDRMSAAGGDIVFTHNDRAAYGPLVALLDHLPLAIELAAARVSVMSPAALLSRMDERFKLLAARGGRHERQVTLRATLDWSWDLLSSRERKALAQCAVFEGGFTFDSAKAVISLPGSEDEFVILGTVQALVEKSLLRRSPFQRFSMLGSVREYAAERLNQDDGRAWSEVAARHWRHFGSLDEQSAIADRCVETENLVAACRRATAAGDLEAAADVLIATWAALNLTGPFKVAVELAQSLHRAARGRSKAASTTALWVSGSARYLSGEIAAAQVDLEEAAVWKEAGPSLQSRVLGALGQLDRSMGNKQRAEGFLEASLAEAQNARDAGLICRAYNALGVLRLSQGRANDARRLLGAGLETARATNNLKQQAALLGNLGVVEHLRGLGDRTVEHYEEALRLASQIGDRRFEGNMRSNLGLVYQERGDSTEALHQLQSALKIARDAGLIRLAANVCCNLGLVQESLGDRMRALEHYREAVQLANGLRDLQLEAHFKIYLGRQLVRSGRPYEGRSQLEALGGLLADCEDHGVLGLFACANAELAGQLGEFEGLRLWVERAIEHLRDSEANPQSELAKEVLKVRRLNSR